MKTIILRSLVALGFLFITAATLAQTEGIRVTGSGTVYGAPDVATFNIGINVLDSDVAAATEEASAAAEQLTAALLEAGVDESDLQTRNFNIYSEDWHTTGDGEQADPLFRVTNTLNVTVRDVALLGELLSTALAAGANQVDSLQFTIANPVALESEARALAVADARERALELAELTGITLGSPLHIEEFSSGSRPMLNQAYDMRAAQSAAVPIEAGELSVTVEVAVTYQIELD